MDLAETKALHQATEKANSQATNSHWYAVHSKPRQEQRALANLAQQGYDCYLPLRRTETIDKRGLAIVRAQERVRLGLVDSDQKQRLTAIGP